MESIKLVLPVGPSANRYWRTVVNRKTLRAMTFVSDEAKAYKKTLANTVNLPALIQSEVSVSVKFFRERRSGDLDNRLKCLFDALQGVVYVSDSQIVEIYASRHEDKNRPRVEVEITPLGLC